MDHLCVALLFSRSRARQESESEAKWIVAWSARNTVSYVVHLVHVSWCVSKVDNSKFQVLKPLEDTSRTKLKFLLVKLPKVHILLELLKLCLQLQKLLEEGFDVLVFFILPDADVPTFFSLWNVKNSLSGIWRRMFIDALVIPFVHFHLCQFRLITLPSSSQNLYNGFSSYNSWMTIFFFFFFLHTSMEGYFWIYGRLPSATTLIFLGFGSEGELPTSWTHPYLGYLVVWSTHDEAGTLGGSQNIYFHWTF